MSEEKENKNKKIAKMTVDEIDAAIKKSVETMNGESSLYVNTFEKERRNF